MAEFGSGPKLTKEFDFEVTTTGDINTVNGLTELEKDISVQLVINGQNYLGRRFDEDTRARIKAGVRRTLNSDPRIDGVNFITINFMHGREAAEVVAGVLTDDGEQELVFEVE